MKFPGALNDHNPGSLYPSLALKYNRLLNTIRYSGELLEEPLFMSATILGGFVPSYVHNSDPLIPSSALKYN